MLSTNPTAASTPSPLLGLTCVIPVYGSASQLPELCRRLIATLASRDDGFEILLIDDRGPGDAWRVITALADADPRVRGVQLCRNFGQHNALLCGVREAQGAIIATLDDDLQHPPEELPKLLSALNESLDVVYGTPEVERHGALRNTASVITKIVMQTAMGSEVARHMSAFRVFRAELRDVFLDYRNATVNIDVLLAWATQRFGVVRVRHAARTEGASGYGLNRLVHHAFNMITGFSLLPLRLGSLLGLVFAILGLLLAGYVIGRYFLYGSVVPGFTFLASIIAVFAGVQLFAIGVIGEYIARIHARSIDRPVYVIRHRTSVPTRSS